MIKWNDYNSHSESYMYELCVIAKPRVLLNIHMLCCRWTYLAALHSTVWFTSGCGVHMVTCTVAVVRLDQHIHIRQRDRLQLGGCGAGSDIKIVFCLSVVLGNTTGRTLIAVLLAIAQKFFRTGSWKQIWNMCSTVLRFDIPWILENAGSGRDNHGGWGNTIQ